MTTQPNAGRRHAASKQPSVGKLRSLGPRRFVRLVDLIAQFDRESERCAKTRAYYAACVLQGAVLEGLLLAMCDGFLPNVSAHVCALPKRQRPKGPIENWTLDQLIRVAKALRWLPARQNIRGRRKIGDWVALVKELRNLVHPGKHVRDYPDTRLRRGHFADGFAITRTATDHLWQKIQQDLLAAKSKGKVTRKKTP